MEWYLKVITNYVGFTGRARRTEYWMFVLINFLIGIALSIVEAVVGLSGYLSGIYSLAIFLPSLAVVVRRLHDTGRSGIWILIGLVPLIGAIVLLIFMCLDSEGDNPYGPSPK